MIDQTYIFAYGETLDKRFSIAIDGCIQFIDVYENQHEKPRCIYNAKLQAYLSSDSAI